MTDAVEDASRPACPPPATPAGSPTAGVASETSSPLRIVLLLAVIALSFVIAKATGATDRITLDSVRAFVRDAGAWGALAYVLAFCLGELVHIPGMLFVFVGILVWGPAQGAALGYVTAVLSVSFTFALVRLLGGQPAGEVKLRVVRWALSKLDARPVLTVTVLRVLFQMNPPINYALALSPIRFRDYLLGSILGLAPPLVLVALLWDRASEFFLGLVR